MGDVIIGKFRDGGHEDSREIITDPHAAYIAEIRRLAKKVLELTDAYEHGGTPPATQRSIATNLVVTAGRLADAAEVFATLVIDDGAN